MKLEKREVKTWLVIKCKTLSRTITRRWNQVITYEHILYDSLLRRKPRRGPQIKKITRYLIINSFRTNIRPLEHLT